MADEVRMLDNKYCLLFIRGERPIYDLKYDLLKHPNIKYTPDGNGKPYDHGLVTHSKANLQMQGFRELTQEEIIERNKKLKEELKNKKETEDEIILLTNEEVEEMYENM